MNFANHVEFQAADRPDELAITDPKREMSYAELDAETSAVANGLAALGVAPGDRVALFLPNLTTFLTSYLGAMKLGAIPVPINLRFGQAEIAHVVTDADPAAIAVFDEAAPAFAEKPLDAELVVVGDEVPEGTTPYGGLVADAEKSFEIESRLDSAVAEILYTSGTTGRPKGVQHTHGNLGANARGGRALMGYGPDTSFLTVAPCFHASGLNATTTPSLVHGAENHFLPEWDPELALRTMAERDVTYTMMIPTMVLDLLEHGTEGYDLSAFESLNVGGSPMPAERIAEAEAALGCDLYEGYGMTEVTLGAAGNRPGQDVYKAGSIGTVAGPWAEGRIEDPETGEAVAQGEKGELLWRGDVVMKGYWNLPEKNDEVFVERPAPPEQAGGGGEAAERESKEWLRSGDIGHVDEDGHLFLDDRIDDMFISGGENVYPREIEDVIYELDGVREAAVVGTPHERLGEQVTAIVRGDVTADEVEAVCRGALADYKVPREIHVRDDPLPQTATMKLDKVALRDEYGG
ncbi:class I adenylate-forming enzyme family protein [Haloglomus litoreum]|uniref:class I adenylate-forming enzyme family protein n=1 Tax=Haloglomus litoreum TaxID=3034026 RepID=UPI0023E84EE9|nr:class I adenylate-forming enzyme family protein [Haloglomus sp. DT116]